MAVVSQDRFHCMWCCIKRDEATVKPIPPSCGPTNCGLYTQVVFIHKFGNIQHILVPPTGSAKCSPNKQVVFEQVRLYFQHTDYVLEFKCTMVEAVIVLLHNFQFRARLDFKKFIWRVGLDFTCFGI